MDIRSTNKKSKPSKDPNSAASLTPGLNEREDTALHIAITENNLQGIQFHLRQPNVNLNAQNREGVTPLHLSIALRRSENLIMSIIEAGCDVNIPSLIYKTTPLHYAVMYDMPNIAHELIKRGADVDAQDEDNGTPLHYAVDSDNLESLCLLLYYDADVSLEDKEFRTPFTYALFDNKLKTAKMLFDYCDDFNVVDGDGCSALHQALLCDSALALQMVMAGADVNMITNDGCSVLELSLFHDTAVTFKQIWLRLDYESLLQSEEPFLLSYIRSRNHFTKSEWIECIYLVLKSPNAVALMKHCNRFLDRSKYSFSFFYELLWTFCTLDVEAEDRITIISICLMLGAETKDFYDLDFAIKLYDFDRELELLIYATERVDDKIRTVFVHPLLLFILAVKDFKTKFALNLCKAQVKNVTHLMSSGRRLNVIRKSLDFFVLPCYMKQELLQCEFPPVNFKDEMFPRHEYEDLKLKLQAMPSVPSLQELSRNQAHKFIRENCATSRPYHFHDAVNNLKLPQKIKDIVRFKVPIYF